MTLLVGTMFFVAPAAALYAPQFGPALGDMLAAASPAMGQVIPAGIAPLSNVAAALVPILTAGVAALPFKPPVEHGLVSWAKYRASQRVLGTEAIQDLLGHPTVKGDSANVHGEYVAMWDMPSVSMRLASESARGVERARWANFLDGLPCPIQTTMRAQPVDLTATLDAMASSPNPNGATLAWWLRTNSATGGEIERRRLLSIRAKDLAQLQTWAGDIEAALARATLKGQRLEEDELRDALHHAWTRKPRKGARIGPSIMYVEADGVRADDEWLCSVDLLSRWPTSVMMDFLSNFYDGTAPVDVTEIIKPLDVVGIRRKLEDRLFRLESTTENRQRKVAIKQLDAMLDRIEQNQERFFEMQVFATVRAPNRKLLSDRRRRVLQGMLEIGGEAAHLRWEHTEGALAQSGVLESRLIGRTHTVDTSSASRAYPFGASELGLRGGIPWGRTLHGNRRVLWTPYARPMIPNPSLAVYATSGGGKGFAVKVITSRASLSGLLKECFMIDQAEESEDGEYGRWARYLMGEVRKLSREHWEQDLVAALADIRAGRPLPPAIVLNIADLSTDARCRSMVAYKQAVWSRAANEEANRCFGIDEMWTYAKDKEASDEGEDLVRRGRHVKVWSIFMTQRPMEALDSNFGRTVQSIAATQWYGMQMPSEISDVAARMRWTPEQVSVIERLGQGEAMLVAGLHRVVYRVDYTPEEMAAFHTDFTDRAAAPRTHVLVDRTPNSWDSNSGSNDHAHEPNRPDPGHRGFAGRPKLGGPAGSLPGDPLDGEAPGLLSTRP